MLLLTPTDAPSIANSGDKHALAQRRFERGVLTSPHTTLTTGVMETNLTKTTDHVSLATKAAESELRQPIPHRDISKRSNSNAKSRPNPSKKHLFMVFSIVSIIFVVPSIAAIIKKFMSPEWLPYIEVSAIVVSAITAVVSAITAVIMVIMMVFKEKSKHD